jgi:hypothetical protein
MAAARGDVLRANTDAVREMLGACAGRIGCKLGLDQPLPRSRVSAKGAVQGTVMLPRL